MAKKKSAAPKKKQNAISRYFRETVAELRKVNWPTREEATKLTWIVLTVIVIMSSFLGIMDYIFSRLMAWIIQLA